MIALLSVDISLKGSGSLRRISLEIHLYRGFVKYMVCFYSVAKFSKSCSLVDKNICLLDRNLLDRNVLDRALKSKFLSLCTIFKNMLHNF